MHRATSYPEGVALKEKKTKKHLFLFWLLFWPVDVMAHDRWADSNPVTKVFGVTAPTKLNLIRSNYAEKPDNSS